LSEEDSERRKEGVDAFEVVELAGIGGKEGREVGDEAIAIEFALHFGVFAAERGVGVMDALAAAASGRSEVPTALKHGVVQGGFLGGFLFWRFRRGESWTGAGSSGERDRGRGERTGEAG